MAPFAPLCAVALLAAAPEGGTITITTASPEAAADYVEAFDQLFAGHGDLARTAAQRALSRDPGLLLAQALLYAITPGTESMQKVDAAAAAGASLPEAERTELAAWAANKHAEAEKGRSLQLKLLELAPRDWRAHVYVGTTEFFVGHKAEEAKGHLREAAALNPKAASVWATLAAIAIEQGDKAGAAEAQKKVADMRPDDPAAQADYAYALITAGRLDEAERTARRAAALPNADAKPFAALANVEYYRSQYANARKDLARARSLSKDDFERMGLMAFELLGYAAEGKYQGALQTADALEKEARARKNPNFYVSAAMNRAFAANLLGKYADGQKHAAEALARIAKEPLSDAGRRGLNRGAFVAALWAQGFGKNVAGAEKTLAMLEKDAAESPNDLNVQSSLWWGRGVIALVKGDAKSAAEEMGKCVPTFDLCHFHRAIAQEKAGDKAGAEATRATLLAQQRSQDSFFLTLRSQLMKKQVRTAAAGGAADKPD
ncbi:MAG TPA: tetratricopeptide repeat protein [Myxococcales bacterium]|nr:tetratricopeptide repeat protein [Myxococcales bacterium]